MTLEAGTQLDRYTILAFLGAGAMGRVYRAFDTRLERAVAIKVLDPAAPLDDGGAVALPLGGTEAAAITAGGAPRAPNSASSGARRSAPGTGSAAEVVASALREARAAAAILHPNATAIFDADRIGDTSFIVMELVPGTSLRRFVGDDTVPLPTRIRWLVDVAGALAAAHRAGVIHRDVKPENVIVRDDGLVKVLDFGIARVPRSPTAAFATLTSGGGLLGTPAYMAPEQIRGEEVDGRADQFSWGVLAYEILAGRLPWGAAVDPIALLAAVLSADPEPLAALPGIHAEIAAAVHRAMSRSPADRFPSMSDAAAALSPFAGARRPLRRPTTPPTAEGQPPSSEPLSSGPAAIELGFSDTLLPPPGVDLLAPDPARPTVHFGTGTHEEEGTGSPAMRTLTSGVRSAPSEAPLPPQPRLPGAVEIAPLELRAPDFTAPVDVEAHLALLPPEATCKGFFFLELLRLAAPSIVAPHLFQLAGLPEHRYVGFRDYPAAEYVRLAVGVALSAYRSHPLGEALRRIGQTAFGVASASLVGKTLFGVYGREIEPLLFTAPRAYRLFLNFGEVTVEKVGPETFLCQAQRLPAFLETYQVGVIEGVLKHAGARGRVRVAVEALDRATIEITVG